MEVFFDAKSARRSVWRKRSRKGGTNDSGGRDRNPIRCSHRGKGKARGTGVDRVPLVLSNYGAVLGDPTFASLTAPAEAKSEKNSLGTASARSRSPNVGAFQDGQSENRGVFSVSDVSHRPGILRVRLRFAPKGTRRYPRSNRTRQATDRIQGWLFSASLNSSTRLIFATDRKRESRILFRRIWHS